jgi:hypothetical protein
MIRVRTKAVKMFSGTNIVGLLYLERLVLP